jgi:WD40 repeat protein
LHPAVLTTTSFSGYGTIIDHTYLSVLTPCPKMSVSLEHRIITSWLVSVVMQDVVNESGLFRLIGHKNSITDLHIVDEENLLISSSKDTFVKIWDLETQHCIATLLAHRAEVDPRFPFMFCDRDRLFTIKFHRLFFASCIADGHVIELDWLDCAGDMHGG